MHKIGQIRQNPTAGLKDTTLAQSAGSSKLPGGLFIRRHETEHAALRVDPMAGLSEPRSKPCWGMDNWFK
jgi:hypothetical protein